MKSVFHIRIDSPGYNSDAIERAFKEHGFRYHSLNWQQMRFNYGIEALRQHIIGEVLIHNPDIIFAHIQNSEILDLDTWKKLAERAFVINYTFDVRDHERTQWMYDAAPHIGWTFFACGEDVIHCTRLGIENTSVMQSSCDRNIFNNHRDHNHTAFDVVFCGHKYDTSNLNYPMAHERERMVEFLNHHYKSNFMAYGLGRNGGPIQPNVEATVYKHSKIAISQNNYLRKNYTSDRLWRIMASGTFCLARYFPGIEEMFEKEKHLDWFNNFDEMKLLIDYYLSNEDERKSIAEEGYKLVATKHSWYNRIEQLKHTLKIYV